jgi:hypothetical protein
MSYKNGSLFAAEKKRNGSDGKRWFYCPDCPRRCSTEANLAIHQERYCPEDTVGAAVEGVISKQRAIAKRQASGSPPPPAARAAAPVPEKQPRQRSPPQEAAPVARPTNLAFVQPAAPYHGHPVHTAPAPVYAVPQQSPQVIPQVYYIAVPTMQQPQPAREVGNPYSNHAGMSYAQPQPQPIYQGVGGGGGVFTDRQRLEQNGRQVFPGPFANQGGWPMFL